MIKKYLPAVLPFIVFSIIFSFFPSYLSGSNALQKLELQATDLLFYLRHQISDESVPGQIHDLVIVTIDQESCEKLGLRWPWPRKSLAALIDRLREEGVSLVGLNFSFTGLEDSGDASTLELARSMRDQGHVIIGETFGAHDELIKPSSQIASAAAGSGYLEKIVDPDYAIRRSYWIRPYRSSDSQAFENSFPLALALSYPDRTAHPKAFFDRNNGVVALGYFGKRVYVDPDGSYTINYVAAWEDFEKIPAWKLFEGRLGKDKLHGKIALIGLSSSLFSDVHATPYGMMPGIAVHANELLAALSGRTLSFVPNPVIFLISWMAGILILVFFSFERMWLGILSFLALFFGLFIGAQFAFASDRVLNPFILALGPVLALLTGIFSNIGKLLWENQGLQKKVVHDKMTGLYTYDFLRMRLEEEWQRSVKLKLPVSVVMTDLDRFKTINDMLGHEEGNRMILRTAAVIKESVRGYDVVARYGGDEFVILLWRISDEDAKAYRLRLRVLYETMAKKLEEALQSSSISIGIATFDPATDPKYPKSPQELIEIADKDLFLDKESRRHGGYR